VSESAAAISHGLGATMEPSPYGMQSKKLTMWLFIASDAITFGAILFAYSYLRVGSANWSRPFQFFPSIANAMVMTAVLLTYMLMQPDGSLPLRISTPMSSLGPLLCRT